MKRMLILIIGTLLLLSTLAFLPMPARAGNFTILDEQFEGAWPGTWSVGDDDLAAGMDYWGLTNVREDGGSFSVWAAQVGTSSWNGQPNSVNGFQDDGMNAYLRRPMEDLAGYASVTVRFEHWLEMATGDALSFRVGTGGSWFTLWSVQGPLSRDWTTVNLDIPLSTDMIEFRYVSALSHATLLEGAYIDGVRITGDDETPPMLSIMEPVTGAWYGRRAVTVAWSADDLGSGIQYTELRLDFGSWFNVGVATSYAFGGLAEGLHSVTVRSVDRVGNLAMRSVAFGVDISAPTATILNPAEGSIVTSSTVALEWQAQDDVSGVSRVEVNTDSGAWIDLGVVNGHELSDLRDGSHIVALRVTDAAGNAYETDVSFRVNTNPLSPDGPNKGLLLYGLIAVGLLILLFALGWFGRLPLWPAALQRSAKEVKGTQAERDEAAQDPQTQNPVPEGIDDESEAGGTRRGRKKAS